MKILVTGIDGLIGQAIAKKLSGDGHIVVGVSSGAGNDGHLSIQSCGGGCSSAD